jgi:hypothetical protein
VSVFRVPRQSLHGPRRKRLDVEYVAAQASTGGADSRTAVGRIESSGGGVVLPLAYGPPSGGVSASQAAPLPRAERDAEGSTMWVCEPPKRASPHGCANRVQVVWATSGRANLNRHPRLTA